MRLSDLSRLACREALGVNESRRSLIHTEVHLAAKESYRPPFWL